MYVKEKGVDQDDWSLVQEVSSGDSFLIQNVSSNKIRYCVLDSVPGKNVKGGVIMPYQQLAFKKVTGDLYIKKDWANGYIVIEQVEG